ncbi:hypothetical protein HBH64_024830 [Parastagonospora nodorum]|nr:hypothetical protein HBH43_005660 [Parastagonospora nodorum]KAH4201316.1 hypothetical protein HBH42_027920 [Parastagonospora nodorum]KAH4234152.1 hypothetical protein HBI05_154360 [Parastagonospora nodorum]KAH4243778.1 hypothetical protein HBI06_006070 [Parastagonospora nodorum]KAH4300544.1 hypothetical protein HBI02_150810 [Parastagonospora nodorum]
MSSNEYNPYNYPYQQSSAQQYSAYQTAPASNNVPQPSRRYQQPATTQANDYMSYQGHTHGGQSNGYGAPGQDNSWKGSIYGGSRETTRGAAEVLRNMSNTSYTPNSTSVTPSSFTAANNTTAQTSQFYTGSSHSPRMQPQSTHTSQSTYGQSQPRPPSVNTNPPQRTANRGLPSPATAAGYPSQRAQTIYNQQQQRSASPAQLQYNNSSAAAVTSSRDAAMTAAASQQFTDYDRRQLASVEASRSNQIATPSTSYNYASTSTIAQPGPIEPPPSSAAETYAGQGSTVDPMAIYDPWPEYQRKQELIRAQKAIEDAARAEDERTAEEARKAGEAKDEERRRLEARTAALQSTQKLKKTQKQQQSSAEASSAAPDADPATGDALEAEIRAMMAKMRELNSKDPALLARIWEEERRAKAAPKSPTVQNKPTTQANSAAPAQSSQANTPQVANQRRKAAPKEASFTNAAKPATPIPAPVAPMSTPAQASTARPGNTIWPLEKRNHLADAAAKYLQVQNPAALVDASKILSMLNSNPSYIELCAQLEQSGLKLDRAAFAKNLLTAVPDVNSTGRKAAPPQPTPVYRPQVPAAVMKKEIATPGAASPAFTPAVASSTNRSSYPPFPDSASPAPTPAPVAEMIPIKPELKTPANKEEAARKRNISELIDMTLLSDDEDMGPPPKRLNSDAMHSYGSPHAHIEDAMVVDSEPVVNNFPIANIPARTVPQSTQQPAPPSVHVPELRHVAVAEALQKKNALRRNNYNPATIARDVLLACGRHPSERQLNQHLEVLRTTLPVTYESDLSTIRWDILDPGTPPPGYFKDSVQALTEDADDEEDSEDEYGEARPRAQSNAIGGESGVQARVQALPEGINPFKQKKRGRPPRHSLPNPTGPVPFTPKRSPSAANMSASAPRPSTASVGYSAFRSATEYGPDGQPLPKKRGRPVGWRKAIHGSVAAQSKPAANGHTGSANKHQPSQPSSLRHVNTGREEPIRINSRSPSVANRVARYQSYKCKWQNCTADLHNLETLKKHVFKMHRKETLRNTLECLWGDCGKEVTNYDPNTNMPIEKHTPHSFDLESNWRNHVQETHFDPLSWELGDGPASGLSEAHDSEAYLSDAQGRPVTPRIRADPDCVNMYQSTLQAPASGPRGRGRPPKSSQEQEAREAQARLVSQKRRIGPGMDRGGATLVNDKRRKGFIDNNGVEEELVDAEE